MRTPILVCLAALTLAACNKPKSPAAARNTGAAAPSANAALPQRRAGVWEVKMDMPGMPVVMNGMRRCFSAGEMSGDDFRRGMGRRGGAACTPQVSRQLDGSLKISGECDMPNGGHAKTDGVVTGDFTSHYKVDMTYTVTDTGTPMDGVRKMSMQANYIGPCPPGVEPGALLDANNKPLSRDEMIAQFRARREARRAARGEGDDGE